MLNIWRWFLHKGNEISKPERVVCLNVDSDQWRQRANIDNPVEPRKRCQLDIREVIAKRFHSPHEQSLNGELRIDQDFLARFQSPDDWMRVLILLGAHRSNISLDTTGSKADCNHSRDQTAEASPIGD